MCVPYVNQYFIVYRFVSERKRQEFLSTVFLSSEFNSENSAFTLVE